MRALWLVVAVACAAQAASPDAGVVAIPAPLAAALPRTVRLTAYEARGGGMTIKGEAKSFDDVSEFMRGLNNLVQCPRGLARVVERQRNGGIRVELIGQPAVVLEYARRDLHFPFMGLELIKTVTQGELVEFELTSTAP